MMKISKILNIKVNIAYLRQINKFGRVNKNRMEWDLNSNIDKTIDIWITGYIKSMKIPNATTNSIKFTKLTPL